MIKNGNVKVEVTTEPNLLYIEIKVYGNNHNASAVIADKHTNVVRIVVDDKTIFENSSSAENEKETKITEKKSLPRLLRS